MKKITTYAFAIAGCALLMACNKKTEKAADMADSLKAKTEAPAAEKEEDKNPYLSPDLALNDLKGPVSKCTFKYTSSDEKGVASDEYWTTEVRVFDVDNFMLPDAKDAQWRLNNPRLERNDKDQITSAKWLVEDFGCDISEEYTYNANGTLNTKKFNGIESADETTYTYNGDGSLAKSVCLSAGEGMIYRITSTYSILESDGQGNWTRRLLTQITEEGPDNGSGKYDTQTNGYIVEVREISYYK